MKNKQFYLTHILILMAVITAFLGSCKKEEADDPNIAYTAFNISFSNVEGVTQTDSIDINQDGINDFTVISGFSGTGDSAAAYMIGDNAGVYIDSTVKYGSIIYKIIPLDKGQAAENISTQKHWAAFGYVGLKLGASIAGIGNGVDKYVPVIVQNPSTFKYHFGWLRVNLSSDFKTYKVIDGAYNIIAEIPIAMGAK